jgi:hypothetical protein
VRRAVGRSIGIALATLAAWALAQVVYIVGLCPPHHAWQRIQSGESDVVLDGGERVAGPGDAIFVCETPHTTGPIQWHIDIGCYCAPASVSADRLSAYLGGTCTVNKPLPTREDVWGACRYARCSSHVDF